MHVMCLISTNKIVRFELSYGNETILLDDIKHITFLKRELYYL